MRFNFFKVFLLISFFLSACVQNNVSKKITIQEKNIYEGSGFVLLFEENLIKEKILK